MIGSGGARKLAANDQNNRNFLSHACWSNRRAGLAMNRITLETGKRVGKPCFVAYVSTVYDVPSMLSEGMTQQEILEDFPELELASLS